MKENKRIFKAAGIISLFTLLSRILGYIRDMVMAYFFGSGLITDAFIAAYRLPNLLRRLFAEGSLVVSFVPVFSDYYENKGEDEAFKLAGSALRVLSVVLFVISVMGVIFAAEIIQMVAPGFDNIEQVELATSLTRIVFPYAFFICLLALAMGILNALGHFSAPAFAPVLLNIAMISSMFIAAYLSDSSIFRIKALAFGVLAGGVIQLGIQIPFLIKKGFLFWQKAPLFHEGLKKIGKMMLPGVLGAGVYQINILVGTILSSMLEEGSISWLYYADRIFQFPLGIFAISIGTAILPSMSRQFAANDREGLKETFRYGLRLVFFISLPAMAGLIVLREPIISFLFERGKFTASDVVMTADALLYYAAGLCSVSAVRVTTPVFYARQDARTPVKIAVVAIISNVFLSLWLMTILQHCGLALATTLASSINLLLLIIAARLTIGPFGGKKIIISIFRSSFCAVIMGYAVHYLALYLIPIYSGASFIVLAGGMVGCIGGGVVVYIFMSLLMKSPEIKSAVSLIKKR